ncbi:hypothetical protein GWI33_012378 [Rhynchophorus ferrugineus]|uniref:Secreted protein n=1 Tax=Rhynchophorus ferrugineus TaxID=354439 RepID=A0A834IBH5_RHYFE|nr:hypothetical protein GWI33_012378 [Rhynchophorus ferrugineus]
MFHIKRVSVTSFLSVATAFQLHFIISGANVQKIQNALERRTTYRSTPSSTDAPNPENETRNLINQSNAIR